MHGRVDGRARTRAVYAHCLRSRQRASRGRGRLRRRVRISHPLIPRGTNNRQPHHDPRGVCGPAPNPAFPDTPNPLPLLTSSPDSPPKALLGEVDRTLHAGPVAAEGGAGAAAHLAEAMQWSRRRAYFCVAGHSPLEDASRIGSAGGREGEPGGPGLTSLANSGEESGGSSDWCTGRAAPRRRPTSPASYLAPRLTEDGGGVMVRGVACRLHYNADEATEEPEVAGAMGDSAPPIAYQTRMANAFKATTSSGYNMAIPPFTCKVVPVT